MEPEQIKSAVESLMFVSNKPLTVKEFAKYLEVSEEQLTASLAELEQEHKNSGVVVLNNGGQFQFATNSQNSTVVKNFLNSELREKLSDVTVEVLAIIAYRQPISKAEIEAIRGVNSQYSLRALLMRGVIEKVTNPQDARGFLYQTTTEFLQHLGITSLADLPEFEKLVAAIRLPELPSIPSSEPVIDEPETQEQDTAAAQPTMDSSVEEAAPIGLTENEIVLKEEEKQEEQEFEDEAAEDEDDEDDDDEE